MKIRNFLKTVFILCFTLLMISYLIFDDGGITTKTWYDVLFMPVPSFLFAALFTGITYLFLFPFIWLYSQFRKQENQMY